LLSHAQGAKALRREALFRLSDDQCRSSEPAD
jgi:hypothetical protein